FPDDAIDLRKRRFELRAPLGVRESRGLSLERWRALRRREGNVRQQQASDHDRDSLHLSFPVSVSRFPFPVSCFLFPVSCLVQNSLIGGFCSPPTRPSTISAT